VPKDLLDIFRRLQRCRVACTISLADPVIGRRYQAKLWLADLPVEKAEQAAGINVA
jgi:hypothetical protein